MDKKSSKAFTLAEVLITLTIIGVIAALTIPNLVQSYRKHQVEVGIKEAYSNLNNAISMAKAEHGSLDECIEHANGNYSFFSEKYIEPYLKITSKCEKGNDTNCKIYGGPNNYGLKCLDGTVCNRGFTNVYNYPKFILANGMYVFTGITATADNDSKSPIFSVDINGENGPNKIGHDIFYFALEQNYPNRLLGGPYSRQLSRGYDYYYTCKDNFTGGVYCVNPIMYNNWKIPDNYPVKKW